MKNSIYKNTWLILTVLGLLTLLLAACVQNGTGELQVTPSAIQAASTETPGAASSPQVSVTTEVVSPTATALPTGTATSPPSPTVVTPSTAPQGAVIEPGNALQVQAVNKINLAEARLFAWMPDSRSLAVATRTDILFYSTNPLAETGRFSAPNATLLAISPDGSLLAWAGEDNTVHVRSISAGSELNTLGKHPARLTSLAFSPDSKTLAVSTSEENTIELWDPAQGQKLATWKLPYWSTSLTFSPDGKQLAGVDGENFTVHIYAVPGGEEQRALAWTDHASPVLYDARFTPDWKTLAWVTRGTIQLMDVASEQFGSSLSHEDFVSAVAISPDSRLLASAAAGTLEGNFVPAIFLWDLSTGEQIHALAQDQPVTSLAFSPDGRSLAILTSDNVLKLWEVPK